MLGELPRNTRHVFGRPCTDVPILTKEVEDLAFLFAVEVGANGDALLGVGRVERHLSGVLGRLERGLADRLRGRSRHGRLAGSKGHEPVELSSLLGDL